MAPRYDAFGLIGTTFRELEWKTRIFFERAVPISPNARQAFHAATSGGGPFFFGAQPSYACFAVWNSLNICSYMFGTEPTGAVRGRRTARRCACPVE